MLEDFRPMYYSWENSTVMPTDLAGYAKMYEAGNRKVALDDFGDVTVSTVFLGLDHNHTGVGLPVLFETMVFGGKYDQYQERYCTEEEARAGHASIVSMVKRGEANVES